MRYFALFNVIVSHKRLVTFKVLTLPQSAV